MNWHYLEPVDVLVLRANKLFGGPGSYGESLVPPWPSAAAGAIRSSILVRDGVDLAAFASCKTTHSTLGSPAEPGMFSVRAFHLARRQGDGYEALYAPPADLLISKTDGKDIEVHRLIPHPLGQGIESSMPTDKLPILAQTGRGKPDSCWWLTEAAYADYLAGKTPKPGQMVKTDQLWSLDERVGIGLEAERRRARDGQLFTVQAVAFHEGIGFLAATDGDGLAGETLLRFGGDGRAARCQPVRGYRPPAANLQAILDAGRCRIVLAGPGLFPDGWRLPGMAEDGEFELAGVKGRVVAAAVDRPEVISGWDLARRQPKTAQRTAPTGSVYWIEGLQASPEALGKLAKRGLWPEEGYDAQRRAEGFNRFDYAFIEENGYV